MTTLIVDEFFDSLKDTSSMSEKEYIKYLKRRSKNGHANSQYELGKFYNKYFKPEKQRIKGIELWIKAAEQGHIKAQNKLGEEYRNMLTVWDIDKSFYWHSLAAEQGHADSQYWMGFMYENGEGVKKDYKNMVIWYQKSAAQGNEKAQIELMERNMIWW